MDNKNTIDGNEQLLHSKASAKTREFISKDDSYHEK